MGGPRMHTVGPRKTPETAAHLGLRGPHEGALGGCPSRPNVRTTKGAHAGWPSRPSVGHPRQPRWAPQVGTTWAGLANSTCDPRGETKWDPYRNPYQSPLCAAWAGWFWSFFFFLEEEVWF